MKSFLYFGIKLEKRVLLHKLKRYPETSKEHPKLKITQNDNKFKNTNKEKFEKQSKNMTKTNKEKCLVKFSNGNSQYPKFSPRQRRQKLDRPQVHGCCSVDQGRLIETKFGLLSVPFLNLLNEIII